MSGLYFEIWFKYTTPFFPKKSVFFLTLAQQKHQVRNFKKMIGVVANIQKISRQRLKELGFSSGQEPTDMKRAHLASGAGNMVGLNYYKASYHNYVIFTPSKEDLQQAGFSGSIYSFHDGRDKVNPNKAEEKLRLKQWVLERCKEVGIPVDETLSNGGFVEEPNDVMAFDFSEIWKCKKNFAFNLPPPGYDTETHGPWSGTSLVPPIGLVGDAVTEPFWIAGVGLQRGWNGVMDACYLIDNLYNMNFSGGDGWQHKKHQCVEKSCVLLISLDHLCMFPL